MAKTKATVHGAISLVNAIATQKGATLGIALKVEAVVETSKGKGIVIKSQNKIKIISVNKDINFIKNIGYLFRFAYK